MRARVQLQLAMMAVAAAGVVIDNVSVRLGLPDGPGLSGVCLFARDGPGGRRHVMFKSVTSSARKKAGDYAVAGELAADRVYEGTFARLEDGDQVAGFGCRNGRRFEIATPFVVPERDLDTMLAVKESMEREFGSRPSRQEPRRSVTAEHVSITLRGLRPPPPSSPPGTGTVEDFGVVVDVFQLYKKPRLNVAPQRDPANTSAQYSALPHARYALRYPAADLVLADLPPDQMLAVKLRRSAAAGDNDNFSGKAVFIYTGGLYPGGTANLTRMLQENDRGVDQADSSDTDVAATSFQIDAKQAHRDSYGKRGINIIGSSISSLLAIV